LSRNGQQDPGVWTCICGRQVPARFEECHCGVTRKQALAAAKAGQPAPRPPLTLLGLALRLGGVVFVPLVGRHGWSEGDPLDGTRTRRS